MCVSLPWCGRASEATWLIFYVVRSGKITISYPNPFLGSINAKLPGQKTPWVNPKLFISTLYFSWRFSGVFQSTIFGSKSRHLSALVVACQTLVQLLTNTQKISPKTITKHGRAFSGSQSHTKSLGLRELCFRILISRMDCFNLVWR